MNRYPKEILNLPEHVLSNELIEAMERLKSFHDKFGDDSVYWEEVNKFAELLLDDKYIAEDTIQAVGLLTTHYDIPTDQKKVPNLRQLLTKHKDRVNQIFAQSVMRPYWSKVG